MSYIKDRKIRHTVICLTYNQEAFIEKAITSLFQGNVWPDEVIIADDCSTDGSSQVIEMLKLRYPDRIHTIINQRNLGVYGNLNELVGLPTGDMIHFFAGDDWWEPGMLEQMNELIAEKCLDPANDSFILIPDSYVYNGNTLIRRPNVKSEIPSLFKASLRHNVYNMMVGLSKGFYQYYPNFKPELGIWADFHHVLTFARHCDNIYLIDNAYPVYRLGSGISSRTPFVEQSASFLKVIEAVSTDLEAAFDEYDRCFIKYLRLKHEAIVNVSIGCLLRFIYSFIANMSNGAKPNDITTVIRVYASRLKRAYLIKS